MKYDFSKVSFTDIEGKPVTEVKPEKLLAEKLYHFTADLDLVEKAIAMNKAEVIELDKVEIEEVKRLVNNERSGFTAFVKKAYLDYIDSVKE